MHIACSYIYILIYIHVYASDDPTLLDGVFFYSIYADENAAALHRSMQIGRDLSRCAQICTESNRPVQMCSALYIYPFSL